MHREGGAVRPVDRLLGVYALVSGFALCFPHRPLAWPILAIAHALVALAGFGIGPFAGLWARLERRSSAFSLLHDWYPLLLIPALYAELPLLNRAVFDGVYFDPLIQRWESTLFGGQPSRTWAASAPVPALSEALHAAYISYYFLIYGPPLILFLTRRIDAFRTAVFVLMLTFVAHYVFFVYFPVQGPRYLFEAPSGEIANGFFYDLAHRLLEAGSSQGAAFPSSHVGVGVAQAIVTWLYAPRIAPIVTVLAAGLAFGAIYGGFHYATDVVAGALLGMMTTWIALRVANSRRSA